MKRFAIIFGLIFSGLALASSVHATVGGPTYIDRVGYDALADQVYFLVNTQSGRGCPPEIMSVDVKSKQVIDVMNCDQIEKKYGYSSEGYNTFVDDTFKNLTHLSALDFRRNGISVDVTYVGEHRNDEYNVSSDFRADFYQNGKRIDSASYVGCYEDEPHVVHGYLIPETDAFAVIISRIGDCFEGGYSEDSLFIIHGGKIVDPSPVPPPMDSSAPQVFRGDLVVYADEVGGSQVSPDPLPVGTLTMPSDIWYQITIGALLLVVIGLVFRIRSIGKIS